VITKVSLENVRGQTKEQEFGEKNLFIGPNGSGKSTLVHAVDLALLGYLPGYQKKAVMANASADTMMAGVVVDGVDVERRWTAGKTLSERVIVNGVPGNRNAAESMLRMCLGAEPRLIDIPAFWAMTGTDKRRMILGMVSDQETIKKLTSDEKAARDALSRARKARQSAEKAVETIVKSLSEMERPVGDLGELKKELSEAQVEFSDAQKRVAEGMANDKARAHLKERVDSLEDKNNQRIAYTAEQKDAEEKLMALLTELDDATQLAEESRVHEASKEIIDAIAEVMALLANHPDLAKQVAYVLQRIAPTEEQVEQARIAWSTVSTLQSKVNKLQKVKSKAERQVEMLDAEISAIERDRKAGDKIGEGLDKNDEAVMAGTAKKIEGIQKAIEPIVKYDTVRNEAEKARIAAQEKVSDEDAAKADLSKAIDAQASVVRAAASLLAERSRSVLPEGELELDDDGTDITIRWKGVQRETLSGGEQVIFDAAVGHALATTALVVLEAAEVDTWPGRDNLFKVLAHIGNIKDLQCVVMTCHQPRSIPEEWNVVDLSGETQDAA